LHPLGGADLLELFRGRSFRRLFVVVVMFFFYSGLCVSPYLQMVDPFTEFGLASLNASTAQLEMAPSSDHALFLKHLLDLAPLHPPKVVVAKQAACMSKHDKSRKSTAAGAPETLAATGGLPDLLDVERTPSLDLGSLQEMMSVEE
jgi:hypothetical protein